MAKRRYRRFPDNGQCEHCSSRKWYQEAGHRYCHNGHRVEDWYEVDEQGGDHFVPQGYVTRKQKETREKKKKQLTGAIARELFLECLQVVLRKQVAWLIREKAMPAELEIVVRDLWDLRIRNLEGVRGADDTYGKKGRSNSAGGSGSASEERLFSSQVVPESDDEAGSAKGRKISLEWSGDNWVVPNVRETLGICYLGCILLREPVRIGDIDKWVRSGHMPYFGTVELLPQLLRERLPPYGQKLLMTMPSSLEGSNLHVTATELMLGYKKNWDITFPSLNIPPLLALYLQDLALPPYVYTHVEQLVPLLGLDFTFPARKQRIKSYDNRHSRMIDNPDALLAGCVILATKYLYPMDEVKRYPRDDEDPLAMAMDWEVWQQAFASHARGQLDFEKVKSGELDISVLTSEEQDAYLDWEQETFLKPPQGTVLQRCFPVEELGIKRRSTTPYYESEDRVTKVLEAVTWLPPKVDAGKTDDSKARVLRIGQKHPRFKHAEDLFGVAKLFYQVVADVSGLSLSDLVKIVYRLEQFLIQWAAEARKAAAAEEEGDFGDGVEEHVI